MYTLAVLVSRVDYTSVFEPVFCMNCRWNASDGYFVNILTLIASTYIYTAATGCVVRQLSDRTRRCGNQQQRQGSTASMYLTFTTRYLGKSFALLVLTACSSTNAPLPVSIPVPVPVSAPIPTETPVPVLWISTNCDYSTAVLILK